MSSTEIKIALHQEIESSEDSAFLEALLTFFRGDENGTKPIELTNEQKEKILRGKEDIRAGRITQNEALKNEIDAWLSE